MKRLLCPFCGARELEEFRFLKTLAEPGTNVYEEVYVRTNRLASSVEHWQHVSGCRAWLLVRRNPSNDSVLEVRLLTGNTAALRTEDSGHVVP
jgi:heterotetrameric sarcosine oxidase delta subunit